MRDIGGGETGRSVESRPSRKRKCKRLRTCLAGRAASRPMGEGGGKAAGGRGRGEEEDGQTSREGNATRRTALEKGARAGEGKANAAWNGGNRGGDGGESGGLPGASWLLFVLTNDGTQRQRTSRSAPRFGLVGFGCGTGPATSLEMSFAEAVDGKDAEGQRRMSKTRGSARWMGSRRADGCAAVDVGADGGEQQWAARDAPWMGRDTRRRGGSGRGRSTLSPAVQSPPFVRGSLASKQADARAVERCGQERAMRRP